MPKRPRSHKTEDLSRNQLREKFTACGWIVWDLHPDYGEDLLVRIFKDEMATHYSFFIQAKSTDHIDRYMHSDRKHLSFPIDIDHLEYWKQFWEPVILTVWDAQSNVTYWEIIQDFLEQNHVENSKRKTLSIDIPTDNILDTQGLFYIFERTKKRFKRFEAMSEATQFLIKVIEDRLDVKIDYRPGDSIMEFSESPGEMRWLFFGELKTILQNNAFEDGLSEDEFIERLIFREALKRGRFTKQYNENGSISLIDQDGTIVKTYHSIDENELPFRNSK